MKNLLLIFFSAFLLFSCGKIEEAKTEEKGTVVAHDVVALNNAQIKNAGIVVESLNNKDIAHKIVLHGKIDVPPQALAGVSSNTGGIVKVSRYMEGNYISRGQTLAVLENPELAQLQQEYLQAKANHGYAQKDYERQQYLNKYQATSAKQMQKAQSDAQNQGAAVSGMASKLRSYGINPGAVSNRNIRKSVAVTAPISGYISRVNVSVGQFVSPAEVLYEIVNSNQTHLALKVFEKDLSKIALDQRVFAYTNQDTQKKYSARIALIGKDFMPDRSVMVHAELIDNDPSLIPGTFMNADIETNSAAGYIIPDDGIVTWENKQYIFEEIKPGTFKMFPVILGNSENGYTELTGFDGNKASKKFVTEGAYQLLMALKNVEE